MRIKCGNLDDFLENLRGESVYNATVYVDKTEHPLNGTSPQACSSWDVYFQASALVTRDEDAALVECGVYCGIYSTTRDGTTEGRDRAAQLRTLLREYCDASGLRLRPGLMDA